MWVLLTFFAYSTGLELLIYFYIKIFKYFLSLLIYKIHTLTQRREILLITIIHGVE
jgi:hypothetical protein